MVHISKYISARLKRVITLRNGEILFFLFLGFLLLQFTSRSIVAGDTAEFIGAASVGGVVHAPGYPLYSLLTHILALIPLGDIAWKINAFSALTSTLVLFTIYMIIKKITKSSIAGLIGVLFLFINETFLLYSFVAEVHSLNILLMSAFIFFALIFWQTKQLKYFYLASFCIGLGFAHNQSIIFTLPSWIIILWFKRHKLFLRPFLYSFFLVLSGFFLYAYTLFMASSNPPMNWGRVNDFPTFLSFLLRQDFGSFTLNASSAVAPVQFMSLPYYLGLFFSNTWFFLPLVGYAIYKLYPKQKFFLFTIISLFFCTGPLLYSLMNVPVLNIVHQANVQQYYGYSHFLVVILAGVGFSYVLQHFPKYKNLIIACSLIIIFFPLVEEIHTIRQDTKHIVFDTIQAQFAQLPPHAVIITCSDSLQMPSYYFQYALHNRPDVTVFNLCLANSSWYKQNIADVSPSVKPFLEKNGLNYRRICAELASKGTLYVYPWFPELNTIFTGCTVIPYGLVNKVVPDKSVPQLEKIKDMNDMVWKRFLGNDKYNFLKKSDIRSREALFYLADQRNFLGLYYLIHNKENWAHTEFVASQNLTDNSGNAIANEVVILIREKQLTKAFDLVELGLQRDPGNALLYKEAGMLYLNMNQPKEAMVNFRTFLEFHTNDVDAPKIQEMINQYTSKINGNDHIEVESASH